MTPITPEALCGQSFSKTDSGYDPAEVDAYIRSLVQQCRKIHIDVQKERDELEATE